MGSSAIAYEDLREKFTQAKVAISLKKRLLFFSRLVSYLTPVFTTDVPIAGVDGQGNLYLNPIALEKATSEEMQFIICHELLHLAYDHGSRAKQIPDLNIKAWRVATEIVVNHALIYDFWLDKPTNFTPIFDPHYEEMPVEAIYQQLANRSDLQDTWCRFSDCSHEPIWDHRVRTASREAGDGVGELVNFLASLGAPKINWRRALRLALQQRLRSRLDWRRPSRRDMSEKLRAPRVVRQPIRGVAYLDTSVSMSDQDLNDCLSEIRNLGRAISWTLMLGDVAVYESHDLKKVDLSKLKIRRGGTDFRDLFEKIDADVLVAFTDLEGEFPDQAPKYPVIWVTPTRVKCPFGTAICL